MSLSGMERKRQTQKLILDTVRRLNFKTFPYRAAPRLSTAYSICRRAPILSEVCGTKPFFIFADFFPAYIMQNRIPRCSYFETEIPKFIIILIINEFQKK